jgi:hypothetical protein
MNNEIYKHDFFPHMYVCVGVVVHFVMGLVRMLEE